MKLDTKKVDRRARKKARRAQQLKSGRSLTTQKIPNKKKRRNRRFDWRAAVEEECDGR